MDRSAGPNRNLLTTFFTMPTKTTTFYVPAKQQLHELAKFQLMLSTSPAFTIAARAIVNVYCGSALLSDFFRIFTLPFLINQI
jgi:hypothetical protein